MQILEIQFSEINSNISLQEYYALVEDEFAIVPWIQRVKKLEATCFLLLDNQTLVGGILLFADSPEEESVIMLKSKVWFSDDIFASCLFVKQQFRGNDYGKLLLEHVLNHIRNRHPYFWAVVESKEENLIQYYKKHFKVELKDISNDISLIRFFP